LATRSDPACSREPRRCGAQRERLGIGVEPHALVDGGVYRCQDGRRRRIGILVRVELDQSADLRLLTRHVGVHRSNEGANERQWRFHDRPILSRPRGSRLALQLVSYHLGQKVDHVFPGYQPAGPLGLLK
jgi:hypothetical protein